MRLAARTGRLRSSRSSISGHRARNSQPAHAASTAAELIPQPTVRAEPQPHPALPLELATEVVVDEPLVIAVSHSDALARRNTVSLDAIRDRALISLPRGTGLRTYLDDTCKSIGFQPRVAFEVGDPRIVAQLAGRGLGVALLPESVTNAHPTQLRAIPLARPGLRGRIALAWRAQQPASPAARAFITHARRQLTRPRTPTVTGSP